jgi:hypothetical protein
MRGAQRGQETLWAEMYFYDRRANNEIERPVSGLTFYGLISQTGF